MIEDSDRTATGPPSGQHLSAPGVSKANRAQRRPRGPQGQKLADVRSSTIPFAQRPTCTIAEACQATGLGRTKLYELIGEGQLDTTTIGRRRLVLVRSLLMPLDLENA